ncbi:hypothetical protein KY289_011882 [Solanum tuberosum]|nr:hypothetical protein KY289_011882 [Solanum tuberosum]
MNYLLKERKEVESDSVSVHHRDSELAVSVAVFDDVDVSNREDQSIYAPESKKFQNLGLSSIATYSKTKTAATLASVCSYSEDRGIPGDRNGLHTISQGRINEFFSFPHLTTRTRQLNATVDLLSRSRTSSFITSQTTTYSPAPSPTIALYALLAHLTLFEPSDMKPGQLSLSRLISFSSSVRPSPYPSTHTFVTLSTFTHDPTTHTS